MTQIIANFAEVSSRYDAAFVDLWGCMHDGLRAFPAAIAAMQAFRAQGGKVVLVTNAPRPRGPVADQIARLGIPDDAWDVIATSGDSARAAMFTAGMAPRATETPSSSITQPSSYPARSRKSCRFAIVKRPAG